MNFSGAENEKRESIVPQECPETGMSHDWFNEILYIRDALIRKPLSEILVERKRWSGQDTWTGKQRDYKVWTYFERLANPEHWLTEADLINERSKNRILQLDEQVKIMNEEIASLQPNEERFRVAWNECYFLIWHDRKYQI